MREQRAPDGRAGARLQRASALLGARLGLARERVRGRLDAERLGDVVDRAGRRVRTHLRLVRQVERVAEAVVAPERELRLLDKLRRARPYKRASLKLALSPSFPRAQSESPLEREREREMSKCPRIERRLFQGVERPATTRAWSALEKRAKSVLERLSLSLSLDEVSKPTPSLAETPR